MHLSEPEPLTASATPPGGEAIRLAEIMVVRENASAEPLDDRIIGWSRETPPMLSKTLGFDFEAVLASVGDGIVCVDDAGKIILFNRAAEEIFGYRAGELLGKTIDILIPSQLQASHHAEVTGFVASAAPSRRSMGEGREVLGVRKDGATLAVEATLSRQTIGNRRIATAVIRDVSARKAAETQRDLVGKEVAHRLRNTMAVVNAIVRLSARGASSLEDFKTRLLGRFDAITRTNNDLMLSARVEADLRNLLERELTPFWSSGGRIVLDGPPLRIDEKFAVALALVFHELTTNAAKYGALSTAAGRLEVSWTVSESDRRDLRLVWLESHGPAVLEPSRRGFGSTLISQSLSPFRGTASLAFDPEGVSCCVELPLAPSAE